MTELLVKLLLIDDDLVFRLGLRTWLEQFPDLQVVGEAETSTAALEILAASPPPDLAPAASEATNSLPPDSLELLSGSPTVNLIILNLGLEEAAVAPELEGQSPAGGLQLCQALKQQYPQIPILLLSASQPADMVAAARQIGVEGYCAKGTKASELLTAIRQVAMGQTYWPAELVAEAIATNPVGSWSSSDRSFTATTPLNPLLILWQNQRLAGLQQIDLALAEVTAQLRRPGLPVLDRAVLAGRWRELRAARWVVNRLLAPAERLSAPPPDRPLVSPSARFDTSDRRSFQALASRLPASSPPPPTRSSLVASSSSPTPELAVRPLQSRLFDRTVSKLQSPLQNLTNHPLEIDILREEKKRELLYIILHKLEETLDELRFAQVQPAQLLEKHTAIIRDL
ncbi:MAG TPA: response regulator transcription factor, partial [Candidatus Obscuribacterales bacterium]